MKTLLKPQLINQAINNNRVKLGLARPFFTKLTSLEGTGEKAKSFVQSILHGAPEVVKEFEKDTFSKLLARGKAINEVQFHNVKPESIAEYHKLVEEYYPKISSHFEAEGLKLRGSWLSEVGELDKAVHIWEYDGYSSYDTIMFKKRTDKFWQEFESKLRPLLIKRENQICLEFAFWATSKPKFDGGVYELRTYLLKPGRMLEWEQNWKLGLECRRQFCEPVGAWFSQLGDLNYVHHMWHYPDLNDRKITRESAWQVDGWAQTVYNTVRLVENMNATILTPLTFSPLK